MKFTLPKPPSINHIYGYTSRGGFARSFITKKGKNWFEIAGKKLEEQKVIKETIKTKVSVSINLYTAYRQDADNIVKPIMDLLQKQLVIQNDSQVYHFQVEKHKTTRADEHVDIEIVDFSR